ncbi:hypothetical protein AB0B50_43130 [Streptomyces sp. NPDC041068]|uniref:hypothetical protein n=1 Tax=Streptomyces sp. NPDC041068 TaxID=3155130 RepID=UPI0033C14600
MPNDLFGRTVARVARPFGGGQIAAAWLCFAIGFGSLFLTAVAARLSSPAEEILVWLQRGIVSAAILVLLLLFTKNPRHSERPRELTLPLGISVALFLAALATAFWPGVFAAFLTPLLVVGSWLVAKNRERTEGRAR